MRAVVAVAAHELRTRWRAWVSLALLVAFARGCVLAAAAGARRTGSAYQRFLVASKASDVLLSPAGTGLGGYYRALARLPSVTAVAPIVGLSVLPVDPGGPPVLASVAAAPLDHRWRHLLEIPKVLAGWPAAAGGPARGDRRRPERGAGAGAARREHAGHEGHPGRPIGGRGAGGTPGAAEGTGGRHHRDTGQLHRLPRSGPPDRRQMARSGPARAQQAGPGHVRRRRSMLRRRASRDTAAAIPGARLVIYCPTSGHALPRASWPIIARELGAVSGKRTHVDKFNGACLRTGRDRVHSPPGGGVQHERHDARPGPVGLY